MSGLCGAQLFLRVEVLWVSLLQGELILKEGAQEGVKLAGAHLARALPGEGRPGRGGAGWEPELLGSLGLASPPDLAEAAGRVWFAKSTAG